MHVYVYDKRDLNKQMILIIMLKNSNYNIKTYISRGNDKRAMALKESWLHIRSLAPVIKEPVNSWN